MRNELLFQFLRVALGTQRDVSRKMNPDDWQSLYRESARQSLVGVVFFALKRFEVPREIYLRWFYQSQVVKAQNEKMNALASRLTKMFGEQGASTLILKGPANALLYPDAFIRQIGDVDIWVEGGRGRVLDMLQKMNLLEGARISSHDVLLSKKIFDEEVEVHFAFGVDRCSPIANKRMLTYLDEESRNSVRVSVDGSAQADVGFYAPSRKFALVMQLSHIYKHLLGLGVGMRQLVDYFVLLRATSGEERAEVATKLGSLGLKRFAGALMWVLSECLGLESQYLLCKPDARRGRVLLREIMQDGNFGKFAERRRGSVFFWWLKNRLRLVRLLPFDFTEVSWYLLRYWCKFAFDMPERIAALVNEKARRNRRAH
ncbi:MAG: nucleotidyltransferase family protein [Fibrobacter sp.]|nr:nucleotidyltransferase family protein [Fibrobacter sp.]